MSENDQTCCGPNRTETEQRPSRTQDRTDPAETTNWRQTDPATLQDDRTSGMVRLEGEEFTMGTDSNVGFPQDGEGPAREVTVDPFYIDKFAVTNAQFVEFVQETGYTTDAERFGWSFVFEDFVDEADHEYVMERVQAAP